MPTLLKMMDKSRCQPVFVGALATQLFHNGPSSLIDHQRTGEIALRQQDIAHPIVADGQLPLPVDVRRVP